MSVHLSNPRIGFWVVDEEVLNCDHELRVRLMIATALNESISSKELGLIAGLAIGRFLLQTEDLHYGFWTKDVDTTLDNLKTAQDRYTTFLLSSTDILDSFQKIPCYYLRTDVCSRYPYIIIV